MNHPTIKGLTITKHITLNLTACQWELYEKPGCSAAASVLNCAVETAVNTGLDDRYAIWERVFPAFKTYEDFGALDTEPRRVLKDILDAVFGEGDLCR